MKLLISFINNKKNVCDTHLLPEVMVYLKQLIM